MKAALLLLLTGLILSAQAVFAADYVWNHSEGGNFGTPSFWTPAGPPGKVDRAIINIPLTDSIQFSGNHQHDRLLVDLTDATLDLGTNTYTLHHPWDENPAILIGDSSGNSRLAVVHGVVDAYDCVIARNGASQAELCVRGDNVATTEDRWTAFQHMITIGDAGEGSLWIDNGGIVEHGHGAAGASVGGNGGITVQDPNSLWHCTGFFALGGRGDGNLYVSLGATARVGRCVMGELRDDPGVPNGAFGKGYSTIDGLGTTWELLSGPEVSLVVGMKGEGYITVRNQGHLHNYGHVTIAETKHSYGELFVQSGGTAEIEKSLSLGRGDYVNDDVKALVHVEGTDSQLYVKGRGAGDPNNPDPGDDLVGLLVGKTTNAKVEVMHGGYLSNKYTTLVGGDATGAGEIVVDGMDARFDNQYRLDIGYQGPGQLSIGNGGVVAVTDENDDPILPPNTKGLIHIGYDAPGRVYVGGHDSNGAPSTLVSAAQIKVGVSNYGLVEVVGGGAVESHASTSPTKTAVIIGATANGEGLVTVADAGSLWQHEDAINVGWNGKGTLEITSGGRVESGYGIVARSADSTGNVSISGKDSVWAIGETLIIGGTAMTKGGIGEVAVSDFGRIELPIAVKIWEGSSLTLDPTATVSADFIEMAGGTIAGSGTIDPYLKITSLARLLTPDAADKLVFNAPLTGIGDLVKEGPGTVTIRGIADYPGLTEIKEGTLQFNGETADLHIISGMGKLGVGTDGTSTVLTAVSITVDTLTIGSPATASVAVPEPSSLALMLGAVVLGLMVRRKIVQTV